MVTTAPPVPQVPAGWAPLPADMATWVTTPFTFLSGTTLFRAELHAAQALGANAFTLAAYDTILEDAWGGWSSTLTANQAADSWLCPAGCSGWFEVSITATSNTPGTGNLIGAAVYLNGTSYGEVAMNWADSTNTAGACGAMPVPMQGGSDYVQAYIWSGAAVNTPATAGRYPTMEITWISS